MRVDQVMTNNVKSCRADDTTNIAAQIMWECDCGFVPVLDGDGRVVGVVTDRDICMAAYTQGVPLSEIRVSTAMAREICSVKPTDTIATAERVMQEKQVRRLPVITGLGELVGVVSMADLTEAVRTRGREDKELSPDGIAATTIAVSKPRARAEQTAQQQAGAQQLAQQPNQPAQPKRDGASRHARS